MPEIRALSWLDMVVKEPRQVAEFYAEVAGLKPQAVPEKDNHVSYSLQDGAGNGVLGICAEAVFPDWVSGWLPYLEIDDFDVRVAKVESAGGRILHQMTMDYSWPGQRFCLVRDPSGAPAMLCETRPQEQA